jgi:S-adenosylmethionine:tRNA-ribosyltransferase-isomerase (queuine synthetase)
MAKMTREAASRIQSSVAKAGGGIVTVGSFAARAMSAAYKNQPLNNHPNQQCSLLTKVGLFAVVAVGTAAAASYYAYQNLRLG